MDTRTQWLSLELPELGERELRFLAAEEQNCGDVAATTRMLRARVNAGIPARRPATPDDRLSRTASAIWRYRMGDPDLMGDPSGDCGDLIAAHERSRVLLMVRAGGYATPGEYNAAVRRSLGVPAADEHGRTPMTYRIHELLTVLEIDDVCERCGAAFDVTYVPARAYGGGLNTIYRCGGCGFTDVCA